jgi:hypothetical protein
MKFSLIQKIFITLFDCFEKIINRSVDCMCKFFFGINISTLSVIFLFSFFFTSCSLPTKKYNYLPKTNNINSSKYGAYIKYKVTSKKSLVGEVISVDSASVIILNEKLALDTLLISDIEIINMRHSKPKFYLWTLSFMLIPSIADIGSIIFMSDFLFLVTAANITSGLSLGLAGNNNGLISGKKITIEELKKFARYPQGIPPDFDVKLIDRNIEKKN